jgi:hypothetical protein
MNWLAELARAHSAGRPYRLKLLDYRMPLDETERRLRAACFASSGPGTGRARLTAILLLQAQGKDQPFISNKHCDSPTQSKNLAFRKMLVQADK